MLRLILMVAVLGAFGAAMIGCHAEGDVQKPGSSSNVSLAR